MELNENLLFSIISQNDYKTIESLLSKYNSEKQKSALIVCDIKQGNSVALSSKPSDAYMMAALAWQMLECALDSSNAHTISIDDAEYIRKLINNDINNYIHQLQEFAPSDTAEGH